MALSIFLSRNFCKTLFIDLGYVRKLCCCVDWACQNQAVTPKYVVVADTSKDSETICQNDQCIKCGDFYNIN